MPLPRILYSGCLTQGELARARYEALLRLGADVSPFDTGPYLRKTHRSIARRAIKKFARPLLGADFNRALRDACAHVRPDVLYVDKGSDLKRKTLAAIRADAARQRRRITLVHFHPDNPYHHFEFTRAFVDSVPEYDCLFCPHPWVNEESLRLGAKRAIDLPYGYDSTSHFREFSYDPASEDAVDAVFVGRWEEQRAGWLRDLADTGVDIHVWGGDWKRLRPHPRIHYRGSYALFPEQRRIFGRAKISLGLLSISNYDGHTTRTFEIPACGGFMLAQRTTGQLAFFEEGKEMACFEGPMELVDKVHYYLAHENERESIREAGHRRCISSGYDYESRMKQVLQEIESIWLQPGESLRQSAE